MNRGTVRTHYLVGKIQRKRPKVKFLLAILAAKAVSGNGLFPLLLFLSCGGLWSKK